MVSAIPAGRAPAAVVVTDTWGSPASLTLSPLLSNQTQPAVFGVKPLPLTVVAVPDTPEAGLNDILGAGMVKLVEISTLPPAGISARTK
jgi:hypothetical protein